MACSGMVQDDTVPTVRIEDSDEVPLTAPLTQAFASMSSPSAPAVASSHTKTPSPTLPPMPPLPSPLLCPRRTFLACLILASKFMQDRSYSNRAWAKLAGLPPREIGRCERALGEALEWRLWVGKCPSPTTNVNTTPRPVARCRSETSLTFGASAPSSSPQENKMSGLRRSATVPTLGLNSAPVQDPFVQHSLFMASKPFAEPERIFPESVQVESPASMFVSPPTVFVTPPAPTFGSSTLHSQTFASILQIFSDDFSPSLSTPGLSYSPMSTASTSSSEDGERTIHMSGFMDLPTPLSGTGYAGLSTTVSCSRAALAKLDLAAQTAMNATPAAGMNINPDVTHQLNRNWTGCALDGLSVPWSIPAGMVCPTADYKTSLGATDYSKMATGFNTTLDAKYDPSQALPNRDGLYLTSTSVPVSMPMVIDPPSGFESRLHCQTFEGFPTMVAGSEYC